MKNRIVFSFPSLDFSGFYLILAFLFGLAFVCVTPPNATPDEMAHQVKIVRVAQGNFFGVNNTLKMPDIHSWYAPLDNSRMLNPPYNISDGEIKTITHRKMMCTPVMTKVNNGVSSYSPLPYLLSALNYKISCSLDLSFGTYLYSSRIVSLIVSVMLVFFAIKITPDLRFVFFTVSMLPTVLYQFSAIAADSFLISLTIIYIACFYRYIRSNEGQYLILIFIASIGICFSKPAYAWIVAVSIPIIFLNGYKGNIPGIIKKSLFLIAIPCVVHILLLVTSKGSTPHAVNFEENIQYLKNNPMSLFVEMYNVPFTFPFGDKWNLYESLIGKLGWLTIPLPKWCYFASFLNFVLIAFCGKNILSRKIGFYMVSLALASLVIICLPLYIYATKQPFPAVFGLQGRYFIPTLLIAMLAYSGKLNQTGSKAAQFTLLLSAIAISFTSLCAVYNGYY